jgi:YHS domain-containing protein
MTTNSAWGITRRAAFKLAIASGLALASSFTLQSSAFAFDDASSAPVNVDAAGIALDGYDPVAYFTLGKPMKGDAAFSASHGGATFHFADAANRDAFVKEPAKFAPQFGGFCAMATVFEKKFNGDPNIWKIVDGKLYLNVSADAAKRWQDDVPGNISKGTENWPKIKNKAPKDL